MGCVNGGKQKLVCEEGIPSPENRRGLPCEDELLNATSPRSPAIYDLNSEDDVNNFNYEKNPIIAYMEKLISLGDSSNIDKNAVLGIDAGLSSCGLAYISDQKIYYIIDK